MNKKLSITLSRKELIFGWIYLLLQLLVIPIAAVFLNELFSLRLSETELNFVLFAINFIATTVLMRKLLTVGGLVAVSNLGRTIGSVLQGFGFYWLGSTLVMLLINAIDPNFYNVNDATIYNMATENYPMIFISTVILAPVAEELLYRGVVFGGIGKKSILLAFIVTVLGFSAMHVVGYIGNYTPPHLLLCLLQYFPPSIVLCYTYLRADTIWAPIILHMLINSIAMFAMR